MSTRGRTSVTAAACLAVSMVACILLLRHTDQLRPHATVDDALYIDSPKIVKRASLGFDGLMACIYWTRTVQDVGERHLNRARSFNELAPLLEITTVLDPQLFPAYQFGASFLAPNPPDGAGQRAYPRRRRRSYGHRGGRSRRRVRGSRRWRRAVGRRRIGSGRPGRGRGSRWCLGGLRW